MKDSFLLTFVVADEKLYELRSPLIKSKIFNEGVFKGNYEF